MQLFVGLPEQSSIKLKMFHSFLKAAMELVVFKQSTVSKADSTIEVQQP